MLDDLILVHFETLQAIEGIDATIRRGNDVTGNVVIVKGRTDSKAVTDREATYAADEQDFLILDLDYAPTGEPTPPQDGDQIVYVERNQTITVDTRPQGNSDQCFTRWRGGAVFRVHTKITSRAAVAP